MKDKKGIYYWYCGTIINLNPSTKRIMVRTLNKKIPIYWRVLSQHRNCICKTRSEKGILVTLIETCRLAGDQLIKDSITGQ